MGKGHPWGAALLAAGVFLLPGGGSLALPIPPRKGPSPGAPWVTSRGPGGTTLRHPKDFKALFGPGGRVRVLGDGGNLTPATPFVLVQPVLPFSGERAWEYLERTLLPRFLSLPGAGILKRRIYDPGRAALLLQYPVGHVSRKALLYCALQDGAGMSYVLSAPARGFDLLRPRLARIAMSLRYGGGRPLPREGGPSPSSGLSSWTDPREGAFTLEAPSRWKVEGGLVKRGPLDFTPTARLTSPGGKVEVFFQDRRCAYFVEPDPELLATGFQEGRWYFSSWGGSLQVLAYRPGARFPRTYLYAPPFTPKGFHVLEEKPLPGLGTTLAKLFPPGAGGTRRIDAGFLLYTFLRKRKPWAGFAFCATLRLAPGKRRPIWRPLLLAGWRALPGREVPADRVLQEVLRSFRMDPGWISAQPGLDPSSSDLLERICKQTASWLEKTRSGRIAILEKAFPLPAPSSLPGPPGSPPAWRLASGHNYYWAPPLSPDPPDLDLSPLAGDPPP